MYLIKFLYFLYFLLHIHSLYVKNGSQVTRDSIKMASTSSDQGSIAQKTWEMSNNIETISTSDEVYRYDRKEQQDILAAKPWEKECVD